MKHDKLKLISSDFESKSFKRNPHNHGQLPSILSIIVYPGILINKPALRKSNLFNATRPLLRSNSLDPIDQRFRGMFSLDNG